MTIFTVLWSLMPTGIINIIILILFLSTAIATPASGWGPWSVNMDSPAFLPTAEQADSAPGSADPTEYSIASTPFIWLLKIYRSFISPIDGDRCPMYPTCSQYSIQAIHKHGPFIGIVMTADRLIHEADEQRHAFAVQIGNKYRYIDTVESNDFWWYGE